MRTGEDPPYYYIPLRLIALCDQENGDYPLPALQRAPPTFRSRSFSCYRIDWI